jgi:hypothetical protein
MQDPSVQIGGLGAIGSTSWAAGTCGSSASVAANMAIRADCDWRMPVRATPSGKRLRNAWLAATSPGAAVRAASHSGQRQRRCSRSSGSSWKRGQSPHRPHPCCVTRSVTPLPERISRRAPAASGIKDPTFQQAHRGPSVDACNGMGELSPARRDRPPLGAMPCLHQNAHCICYGAVRRPPSEGGRGHSWLAPHIGPKSG